MEYCHNYQNLLSTHKHANSNQLSISKYNSCFCITDYRSCNADEFQCDSGQCIPLEHKCRQFGNDKKDCVDKSHLQNCSTLILNRLFFFFIVDCTMF